MSGITKLHLATLFCHQNDYHGTCIARGTVSMEVTGTRPRDRLDRLESDIEVYMCIYEINPEMSTDRERWAVVVKTSTQPSW